MAVTHVCFRNGGRLDVEGIGRIAHEAGAPVLVDAYQTIGSLPIDVRALDCDFLAAGVLKYLLGSAGLGFLYCRRELVQGIEPTATGWFADRDIFEMDIHDYSPAPTARRFEAGTPPVPSTYAAIAGIELMQEIGIAETEAHVRELNALLHDGVEELGGRVVDAAGARAQRRARLHPLDRRRRAGRRARRRGHRHLVARRQAARLGPLLQHGRGRPGRARRRWRRTASCSPRTGDCPRGWPERPWRSCRRCDFLSTGRAGKDGFGAERAGTLAREPRRYQQPAHLGDACA